MGQREMLQSKLEEIIDNVYFQPPPDIQMIYPCIVYKRDSGRTNYADNDPYRFLLKYQITLIDRNPDSEAFDKITMFPTCVFDRHFVVDNLNHDVFTVHV